MTEPFSHEDFMEGGQNAMAALDTLRDPEIQEAFLDLRSATDRLNRLLLEHDIRDRGAAHMIMGSVLGNIWPDGYGPR